MRRGRVITGQGSNSAMVGDFNARVVLAILRRCGPASKADLARRVGLTKNAAGEIVRRLEADGLVRAMGKRVLGRGQPATILDLNPKGAYAIGARVDRDMMECLLVDLGGTILDRLVIDGLPEPVVAVRHIAAAIERFEGGLTAAERKRLTGIGLAMPFNLGSWLTELALPAEKFREWDRFDFAGALAATTHLPVIVENDDSAAAVGELNQGRGREVDSFLYVFLGPAIGGGVVIDGDYLRGRASNAGDLGVMPVPPSGLPSAPVSGRRYDPLLSRASLNTLSRHLAFSGPAIGSRRELDAAVLAHPAIFAEWRADAVDAMVGPILASVHLLDLDTVVLDGDLAPAILDDVILHLAPALAAATAESREPPRLLRGLLGRDAAAIGAATLPLHMSFNPMHEVLTGQGREWAAEVSA